jgi:hypothetical protein
MAEQACPTPSLGPCHTETSRVIVHHTASHVKDVEALVTDALPGLGLLYKLKPTSDQHMILAHSSLPVKRPIKALCKTVCTSDRVWRPGDTNLSSTICIQQLICHSS